MLKWCPYQMNKQRKSHTVPPRTKQDILRELEDDIRKGTLGEGGMVGTVVTTPTRGPGCFCLGFLPADPAAAGHVQTLHLSPSLLARWCITRTWEKGEARCPNISQICLGGSLHGWHEIV